MAKEEGGMEISFERLSLGNRARSAPPSMEQLLSTLSSTKQETPTLAACTTTENADKVQKTTGKPNEDTKTRKVVDRVPRMLRCLMSNASHPMDIIAAQGSAPVSTEAVGQRQLRSNTRQLPRPSTSGDTTPNKSRRSRKAVIPSTKTPTNVVMRSMKGKYPASVSRNNRRGVTTGQRHRQGVELTTSEPIATTEAVLTKANCKGSQDHCYAGRRHPKRAADPDESVPSPSVSQHDSIIHHPHKKPCQRSLQALDETVATQGFDKHREEQIDPQEAPADLSDATEHESNHPDTTKQEDGIVTSQELDDSEVHVDSKGTPVILSKRKPNHPRPVRSPELPPPPNSAVCRFILGGRKEQYTSKVSETNETNVNSARAVIGSTTNDDVVLATDGIPRDDTSNINWDIRAVDQGRPVITPDPVVVTPANATCTPSCSAMAASTSDGTGPGTMRAGTHAVASVRSSSSFTFMTIPVVTMPYYANASSTTSGRRRPPKHHADIKAWNPNPPCLIYAHRKLYGIHYEHSMDNSIRTCQIDAAPYESYVAVASRQDDPVQTSNPDFSNEEWVERGTDEEVEALQTNYQFPPLPETPVNDVSVRHDYGYSLDDMIDFNDDTTLDLDCWMERPLSPICTEKPTVSAMKEEQQELAHEYSWLSPMTGWKIRRRATSCGCPTTNSTTTSANTARGGGSFGIPNTPGSSGMSSHAKKVKRTSMGSSQSDNN